MIPNGDKMFDIHFNNNTIILGNENQIDDKHECKKIITHITNVILIKKVKIIILIAGILFLLAFF